MEKCQKHGVLEVECGATKIGLTQTPRDCGRALREECHSVLLSSYDSAKPNQSITCSHVCAPPRQEKTPKVGQPGIILTRTRTLSSATTQIYPWHVHSTYIRYSTVHGFDRPHDCYTQDPIRRPRRHKPLPYLCSFHQLSTHLASLTLRQPWIHGARPARCQGARLCSP